MTTRHVLSDNGWIDLRANEEVSERHRRPIKARIPRLIANQAFAEVMQKTQADGVASLADIPEERAIELAGKLADSMGDLDDLNDLLVIARVAAWSYGETVNVDTLLDLPSPVYDEIRTLVSAGALSLMPDFSPTQADDSPTVPSTA